MRPDDADDTQSDPASVLAFWVEAGPASWFKSDPAFDAEIRTRFVSTWRAALEAGRAPWSDTPEAVLASVILLDQFPRNMFREDACAFATDAIARDLVRTALAQDMDLAIAGPERHFFYMPLIHAEDLADQDAAIAVITAHMPDPNRLLHARAHRRIIRQFGRFPFRNKALGRETTADEQAFLDAGGYGGILRAMEAETGPKQASESGS